MGNTESLDERQKQEILKKRQELFKKMGVNNAGKINESFVSANGSGNSMAAKLAAIRNGSAKAELNKYISATSKGESGTGGFHGIPEPKMKKNHGVKEEINPEYRQSLESFDGPKSSNPELSAIDAMFGGGGVSSGNMGQSPLSQDLSIDSMVMPTFDPQAALQKNLRTQQQKQTQGQNPYLKFASETPAQVPNDQFVDMGAQPVANIAAMQNMMETIAKGIAEKTIRNVLNEYSEQQRGKLFFEYYNKDKTIIKTPDGKYFRLTQVELKKKS